uniref:Putative tail protein n=1 Tax=viral metagenome TaxID=1070528 RepID=A0A6M3IFK9_9ZZZZ
MNLRLMALNIREFCPFLSIPVIKQRINVRYKQIIGAEDWEFLRDSTTVKLIGVHTSTSSETVTVTEDSTAVLGVGTTFTTDCAAGDYFLVGTEDQPYVVSSVTDNLNLVLEQVYGGATTAGASFSYYRLIYSPTIANVGQITSIVYQGPLYEVSEGWINARGRTSTGSPSHYSVFSKTKGDGIVSFEIWPIPDADYVVTVFYRKYVVDLTTDTDEPVFRPELIEAGALWDCYRLSFATTQNPAFIGLARDAKMDYVGLLRDALIEDVHTSSVPTRVRDVSGDYMYDNNFLTKHDVGYL